MRGTRILPTAILFAQVHLTIATRYPLYHRHLSYQPESFVPYGHVEITPPQALDTSSETSVLNSKESWNVSLDIAEAEDLQWEPESGDGRNESQAGMELGWYQIMLEDDGRELVGSTKACYLSTSIPNIHIHLSTIGKPISISLSSSHIPKNGSCPLINLPITSVRVKNQILKVILDYPIIVQEPKLSPPPNLDPFGLPIIPPPEKTFLQKYWMPLLGVGVFLVSQMADPDRGGGGSR
ncbi:hypothetical protein M231_03774 [Tremella mesenterica]|uniref:ER membrane protein complex subunit 10 n=1 Tax=Tremella mesenterica TaxID=5217 RepID=A0A4Q1BM90_TREME|nr:hypothetical protein M231_03774 [Tremella mesenterica]